MLDDLSKYFTILDIGQCHSEAINYFWAKYYDVDKISNAYTYS